MDTPPSIRRQYASPPRESPEQRRRRLANRRAAKYRHFKALSIGQQDVAEQRTQNAQRQRRRRAQLDDAAKDRVRAQNRRRQQLRRQTLSDGKRAEIREKQKHRQRLRRETLDDDAKQQLRERERLRVGRRRRKLKEQDQLPHPTDNGELPTLQQQTHRLPFGDGGQITLPPPPPRSFVDRIPSLPHLQQVTRPNTTLAPPPLFPIAGALTSTGNATSIMPSVSLPIPSKPLAALPMVTQQQPRTPIVLPPAHRSLPPLPDFLSSREAFNPANAAGDTRHPRRAGNTSRSLFPSINDLPVTHTDVPDPDAFFLR